MDKPDNAVNWTTARVTRDTFKLAEQLRKQTGLRSVSAAVSNAIRFLQDPANAEIRSAFAAYIESREAQS